MTHGTNVAPEKVLFESIVLLEKERQALGQDIKELYGEAKEKDIDVKALRRAVKLHLEDSDKRAKRLAVESEAERILAALGEFVDTPLGGATAANLLRQLQS